MDLTNKDYWLRHLGVLLMDVKRYNYGVLSARAEERITKVYLMLLEALMEERKTPAVMRSAETFEDDTIDEHRAAFEEAR